MGYEGERIPLPHNLDAERAVLGCCLLQRVSVLSAISVLKPDDFFQPKHRLIFETFKTLIKENKPVDLVTLTDRLMRDKALDQVEAAYIAGLTDTVPTIRNTEYYSGIVLEKARLRNLIKLSHQVSKTVLLGKDDADTILDSAMSGLIGINKVDKTSSEPIDIENAIADNEKYFDEIEEGKRNPPIKLGYPRLDSLITLLGGNLMVIGGRPSHGKTALAVGMTINMIFNQKKVLFISAEMDKREMTHRFISVAADIPISLLRKGTVKDVANDYNVSELIVHKKYLRFICPDRVNELDVARILKYETLMNGKPDILIIDYLQRMRYSGKTNDRRIQIGEICNSLKDLIREFEIPCILLSQLSRPTGQDRQSNKPPTLWALKEAGEIENVSDVVLLIHRLDDDKTMPYWDVDILLEKNRNGPLGDIRFEFERKRALFRELEPNYPPSPMSD